MTAHGQITRCGTLRIFLGVTPGQGKTKTMLEAATQRDENGADVVVGVLEEELDDDAALVAQQLKPAPLLADGLSLDIDEILLRNPDLVLIDAIQCQNGPRARHRFRYQDARDLVDAGIDVFATINIVNLDSLKDVVAEIAGGDNMESVPDYIVDGADEVEFVDALPSDLVETMKEKGEALRERSGDVPPALYSIDSLQTLRQLALRKVARWADRHRDGSIDRTRRFHAGGRLMIAVTPEAKAEQLVRLGQQIASRGIAVWFVASVETADLEPLDAVAERERAAAMRLADSFGAEPVTITGNRSAEAILEFAWINQIDEILVARTRQRFLPWPSPLEHRLIAMSGSAGVHVVDVHAQQRRLWSSRLWSIRGYLIGICAIASLLALTEVADRTLSLAYPSLLLLVATLVVVLFSAVYFGLGPALTAGTAGITYLAVVFVASGSDIFRSPDSLLLAGASVAVIAVAIALMGRLRRELSSAQRRELRFGAVFRLSRAVAGAIELEDVLENFAREISNALSLRCILLLPATPGSARLEAVHSSGPSMDDVETEAAKWAFSHRMPTGAHTNTLGAAKRLYHPLFTRRGPVGVVGLEGDIGRIQRDHELLTYLEAFSDIGAIAIERVTLAKELEDARIVAEAENLRSALLASVSHDLRTPLAAVIGSASSLIEYGDRFDEATRLDLLRTIQEEAERLNRFVGNVLDMTRLESGVISLKRRPVDAEDLVGTVLHTMSSQLKNRCVVTNIEAGLPPINGDIVLLEHVLQNLLENAARYSPAEGKICVGARRFEEELLLWIEDDGVGISVEDQEKVFDKFYRARQRDRRLAGSGLGLTISRAILELHGGAIEVHSDGSGKGTTVTCRLPIAENV